MRAWIGKKLITALIVCVDALFSRWFTEERCARWRRSIEDLTIGRAVKLEQRAFWKKKKSNNAFAKGMVTLLKSNRLKEFQDENVYHATMT